jgi:hypothetical protein
MIGVYIIIYSEGRLAVPGVRQSVKNPVAQVLSKSSLSVRLSIDFMLNLFYFPLSHDGKVFIV